MMACLLREAKIRVLIDSQEFSTKIEHSDCYYDA